MKGEQKNITAIAATVILILAVRLGYPVYGQGNVTEESNVVFDQLKGKKDVETGLVGTIEVTLISAIVPSDVDFIVNLPTEFNAVIRPGDQIISPGGLSVINHSIVPVKLETASVAPISGTDLPFSDKFPGGPVQDFALVGTIAETKTPGRAILVLGRRNQTYTGSQELEQYAICPGGIGTPVAETGAEEKADLQIYGEATADFYGAYQFIVKPALKISIVKAQWRAAGLYKK